MTTHLAPLILAAKSELYQPDSPTRNPCMVRVTHNRHRNDPYKAQVLEVLEYATPPRGTAGMPTQPVKPALSVKPIGSLLPPLPPVQQRAQRASSVARRGGPAQWLQRRESALVVDSPYTGEVFAATQFHADDTNTVTQRFCSVRFKLYSKLFRYLGNQQSFAIGNTVMVEGDRGEHIGVVESIYDVVPEDAAVHGDVLRVATPADHNHLEGLREQEVEAMAVVRRLATATCPRMVVRDVEIQFDGKKITILFESKGPCDFRNLQRALYQRFHCRIWFVSDFSKVL